MEYRDIDHLLLNVNKWPGAAGSPGADQPSYPGPGDSIMVAVADRGPLRILVHQVYADHQMLRGSTTGEVRDQKSRAIIPSDAPVSLSFRKIAGIHRR